MRCQLAHELKPRIAFTAVIHKNQYVIGAAEEGVPGWTPTTYDPQPTYAKAQELADLLNQEKLGLTNLEATEIVLSSMFAPLLPPTRGGFHGASHPKEENE